MDDNQVVTVGLVVICFAVAGAAVGIALYIRGLVDAVEEKCRSDQAVMRAELGEESATIAKEFSAYKTYVAETYMSKQSGGAAIDRATVEMRGFRDDIKTTMVDLANRLGRVEGLLMREQSGGKRIT